ncbi:hypothetical protein T459_22902 [Capsicum annuum]|uniref:Uncharacterized protein n=1 Tax=Capsicum annuum TaxID=4072 RepID=A0A2G2YQT2_CAPAN|nr:hypothetical protein T459_22902 [Capsicum annuum]
MAILSAKKLIKMARRWRKFTAKQRKRISFPRTGCNTDSCKEFGLPSSSPITLPCDSSFMEYIISLIKKGVAAGDLHRTLLLSIPSFCCTSTSYLHQESGNQQLLVY